MTYLLDTCLISEVVAKQPEAQVLTWLDAQMPETLYLSVITIGEIAKGIAKLPASARQQQLTIWLNETLPQRFSRRIINYRNRPANDADLGQFSWPFGTAGAIASPHGFTNRSDCSQHELTLVTRNEIDFIGTNIKIFNPWMLPD